MRFRDNVNVILCVFCFHILLLVNQALLEKTKKMHFRKVDHSGTSGLQKVPPDVSEQVRQNRIRTQNNSKRTNVIFKPKQQVKPQNITILEQTGTEAILPCPLSKLNPTINSTLIWAKNTSNIFTELTKVDIIYTGELTNPRTWTETIVTNDKRFLSQYEDRSKNWNLRIRYTENKDEGVYQCQVQSGEESTSYVTLKLEEAWAEIIGGPVRRINSEKLLPLRLSCVLKNSIEPPENIFWYHEDRVINYDLGDGAHVREGDKGSELIFPKANRSHVGNYSCVPSNARQASIIVLYGNQPEPEDLLPNGECGKASKNHNSKVCVINILMLLATFHLSR